jgi:DNA-binding transcriptional regulator YiaG
VTVKPYPWKCGNCRERAVSPATLAEYTTRLDHDGKSYEVVVPDLDVLLCAHCDAVELTDEAGDRLVEALRRAADLLSPAQIRAGREALGLTQKQLAGHLRISETSLSRWETGAQMQQKCMDLLLKATFGLPAFREFVGIEAACTA